MIKNLSTRLRGPFGRASAHPSSSISSNAFDKFPPHLPSIPNSKCRDLSLIIWKWCPLSSFLSNLRRGSRTWGYHCHCYRINRRFGVTNGESIPANSWFSVIFGCSVVAVVGKLHLAVLVFWPKCSILAMFTTDWAFWIKACLLVLYWFGSKLHYSSDRTTFHQTVHFHYSDDSIGEHLLGCGLMLFSGFGGLEYFFPSF